MGILDSFNRNKRKAQQNEQYLLDEEGTGEADLWSKVCVVEPQCYGKEGREKLLNFVIIEGVNTILPMYPNELYKNEEENFSDIRLTLISTAKKGEVVNLPFFHCVPALSSYTVEYREPNVLVKGLDATEMGLLISDAEQSLKRI